ncbi:S41 family peptidase [Massilia sp. H6]|uniref:S41 family peptidase n=1 Tax=Massilia sp. H6 TaxID=2970464 RepID=UPI002169CA3D|nr:S41 family peptidase [Massilia sp. H6]UVW29408.1 S41 family peptidase [Massilia sp. H6]
MWLLSLLAVLWSFMQVPTAAADEASQTVTAAQFRADLAFMRETIVRMHPDPEFSTNKRALDTAFDRLGQDVPPRLTRDEAWRRLASLNPLFADAHFLVGYADWRGDTLSWLAGGGTLFPLEVELDEDAELYVRRATPSAERERIVSINGIDARTVVRTLLAKTHGDTPSFRARLLAQRWWLFYWKTYGAPLQYRLALEKGGQGRIVDLPGSRAVPAFMRDEAQFAHQFNLDIRCCGSAVLTVGSFSASDPAPFMAFTHDAFTKIRNAGVTSLVIDISNNGGGDDAMWLDGLMPYLATTPYRTGSTYRAMSRARPGVQGEVSDGEISTWRQPQLNHPLHFGGKIVVKIGPATYSSAILFANVMRDFGLAKLVGRGGAARRSQSGGVRGVSLPHTGLVLSLPRFILDPPAGRVPGALLEAQAAQPGEL